MKARMNMLKALFRRKKRVLECRAALKTLEEQREDLCKEMQGIVDAAKTETRAMTEEETKKFESLEKQIQSIDISIAMEKRSIELMAKKDDRTPEDQTGAGTDQKTEERAAAEEKAFADYIRGIQSEERADVNMTATDNGAVIPTSISNRIIARIKDICPIYEAATKYMLGGSLAIPYYDESTSQITMAYAEEFTNLTSTSGKFDSITLQGYLAGALTKISKRLVNNSQFGIVEFVIQKMAEAAVAWIERELLIGTKDKIQGLSTATQIVTAGGSDMVELDDMIDLQEEVPDLYQGNAFFIVNRSTRKALRKKKDKDGNYILQRDATAKWGYTLFGKDIYTSDSMPEMAPGEIVAYYGDFTGLAVKIAEESNIEVLREVYASQHALGVILWLEMDAKIENQQKIAVLKMADAAKTQSGK